MEGGWPKDIHVAFFGNVVRGKSAFFRLVVRNGFAHFVRKVFLRRKLLPGKFLVFVPLVGATSISDDIGVFPKNGFKIKCFRLV